ncbi:hypothetical protein N0V83_010689 [Neocucurbitaria cava]|uniref:Xylanolytic transcriptional activator regulatory domain-containing protein n=1 Tax=Neocucurbitaria cava TaxID=798079 RepID=A0A9W8XZV9_9PLEO|nr:hypothetical protein N0V83_010689 [Neocucurbitaria cava]
MIHPLYTSTKQMLEAHSFASNEPTESDSELLLAWVLIALSESMQTLHRRAWMSAGQAFRMVQALRFHDIDSPRNSTNSPHSTPIPGVEDFIEVEQRRRVFWMAYFLDHLLSIRNDWPVTLNEHVVSTHASVLIRLKICTRLPTPNLDFQTGQFVLGDFLSEAMTDPRPKLLSPFNECLIMVTICGRSLLRGQQQNISKAYGDTELGSAEQRWWLDGILTTRLQVMSQCYPSPGEATDPLLLFAHILAPVTVLYYCNGMMESLAGPFGSEKNSDEITEYRHRALDATATVIRLAESMSELHFSKARKRLNRRVNAPFR